MSKKKQAYTVRIEWDVRYYCDTTVEATSPAEAKQIALDDPDYGNQESYGSDMDGESEVEGVCLGYEFDISKAFASAMDEVDADHKL